MIKSILQKLVQFRDEREWKQFHSPINLLISLQIEVAELMEHFQWMSVDEFKEKYMRDTKKRQAVKEEIADVFSYLLLLSNALEIDLEEAINEKIDQNDKKYPVIKAKGNAKKYTELKDMD